MKVPRELLAQPWEKSLMQRMAEDVLDQKTGRTRLDEFFEGMTENERLELCHDWTFIGRPDQQMTHGQSTAFMRSGRGTGKTRLGAEWCRIMSENGRRRIIVVAKNSKDIREIIIAKGFGNGNLPLSVYDPNEDLNQTYNKLKFKNGCEIQCLSGDNYDSLRGHGADFVWCDEACKQQQPRQTFEQISLILREGGLFNDDLPRMLITTTPKWLAVLQEIENRESTITRNVRTFINDNIDIQFMEELYRDMRGTKLYRQEVLGEWVNFGGTALWNETMIKRVMRVNAFADHKFVRNMMQRVVVAIDPAGRYEKNEEKRSDLFGISVCGLMKDGNLAVLEDATTDLGVHASIQTAVRMLNKWDAEVICQERNYGGDAWKALFDAHSVHVPTHGINAVGKKQERASPIAMMQEQGEVLHFCEPDKHYEDEHSLKALETQMFLMFPEGYAGDSTTSPSPDRVDAMVHAMTYLKELRNSGSTFQVFDTGHLTWYD